MKNWKEIYEEILKRVCEPEAPADVTIVEIEKPDFEGDLILNPNATDNSLYAFKLDKNATEEDYKKFVEFIYAYMGLDYKDFIKEGEGDMEEQKIRDLLKKYGAADNEIENFMNDLIEKKEEAKENEALQADEEQAVKDYEEEIKETKNSEDKAKLEHIKEDEEEHKELLEEINPYTKETRELLLSTEAGRKILREAPSKTKEDFIKEIKEFLNK